jgi:predicted alpha-1,6-mannanase (GH76 family)
MQLISLKWRRPSLRVVAIVAILCSVSGHNLTAAQSTSAQSTSTQTPSYQERATLSVQALQSWYDLDTGLYKTTGWWNSANAITTLADYARITRTKDYDFVFSNTLSIAQKTSPGFINKYYDDEGWWALAWIDVYGITRDDRYLAVAKSIFADMTYGWDDTCSGGIWWSKDRKYKNAIANELFLSVAAQLANVTKDPQDRARYLSWAKREWTWFARSGMINSSNLINDGLTGKCENNHQTTWTYNQGVILGGLVALQSADHDAALLTQAHRIADAALTGLSDQQGILHDSCEPKCGGDGTQFKGIFVRNLRALDEVHPDPRYESFALKNSDSIWTQVHDSDYRLGEVWTAPYGASDASSQSSALDTLVTAAQFPKKVPANQSKR